MQWGEGGAGRRRSAWKSVDAETSMPTSNDKIRGLTRAIRDCGISQLEYFWEKKVTIVSIVIGPLGAVSRSIQKYLDILDIENNIQIYLQFPEFDYISNCRI